MAQQAKDVLDVDSLEVVADRGYYSGEEILACEEAGITAYVPKPQTSANKAKGSSAARLHYIAEDDEYECPAGQRLSYRFTSDGRWQDDPSLLVSSCPLCDQGTMHHRQVPTGQSLGA